MLTAQFYLQTQRHVALWCRSKAACRSPVPLQRLLAKFARNSTYPFVLFAVLHTDDKLADDSSIAKTDYFPISGCFAHALEARIIRIMKRSSNIGGRILLFEYSIYSFHPYNKFGRFSPGSASGRASIDLFVKWRPAGLTGQLFAAAARIPRDPIWSVYFGPLALRFFSYFLLIRRVGSKALRETSFGNSFWEPETQADDPSQWIYFACQVWQSDHYSGGHRTHNNRWHVTQSPVYFGFRVGTSPFFFFCESAVSLVTRNGSLTWKASCCCLSLSAHSP